MKGTVTYPTEFLQRMKAQLGSEYDAFMQALDTPAPTSIRLNPFKPTNKFEDAEHIPWCEAGRYLSERPSFTFDPLFHAGTYYVQEASSMLIEQAYKHINPDNKTVRILDMCAAPGGKSTHLLSLINEKSLLVSNELIPNRNKILQENIIKWGNANCIVTQNKAEDFTKLSEYFDIILVDAPCSGEGLFRKDKDAINEWSEKNVEQCSIRQKEILQNIIQCLKPGGHLIYSTCTFEPVENDENVAWMNEFGVSGLEFRINTEGIVKTKYGYQVYPHRMKGEGFYIAVLQKEGEPIPNAESRNLNIPHPSFTTYLESPADFNEITRNDLIFAIPKSIFDDFNFLSRYLYIRHSGLVMGQHKGKDFLPSHDLALSQHLKKDMPAVELSYEDAITYLRSESPKIKTEYRGWCLAQYQGKNLGWMKALDNRINNYFPKELRILKK